MTVSKTPLRLQALPHSSTSQNNCAPDVTAVEYPLPQPVGFPAPRPPAATTTTNYKTTKLQLPPTQTAGRAKWDYAVAPLHYTAACSVVLRS